MNTNVLEKLDIMWRHIEGPNLIDVKPTQVQNMIEKKLDQSTLHLNNTSLGQEEPNIENI